MVKKIVRFSLEPPEIHLSYVWNYASRKARIGEWETLARDRFIFAERCRLIEHRIKYIFNIKHRENVYKSRFIK